MLFTYTENPPENWFFAPGFLRPSGWRTGYTENSSFPYIPNVVALNRVIYAALKPYT